MSEISSPKLPLPPAEETIALRAVVQVLADDPTLRACGVTMHAWTGDVADVDEPTVANCPYLRVTPTGGASGWTNQGQHELACELTIEAAVVGSDVDQLLNLWAAVRRALWPGKTVELRDARRSFFHDAGIIKPTLTRPGFGVVVKDAADDQVVRFATATGTLTCTLHVNTP